MEAPRRGSGRAGLVPDRLRDSGRPRRAPFERQVLWSSGRVSSSATDQVEYAGSPLAPRDQLYWRVRVWDGAGKSEWSETATFGIGLLDPRLGRALDQPEGDSHVHHHGERPEFRRRPRSRHPAPHPAKVLSQGVPHRARRPRHAPRHRARRLHRGNQWQAGFRRAPRSGLVRLSEPHPQPDLRCHRHADRDGNNAIGATLADGWYAGYVAYGLLTGQEGLVPGVNGRYYYGITPALRLQLELELADGSREIIITDPSWKTSLGPITEADILMGESYDARKEMPGWSSPGFDDANWKPAVCTTGTNARIEPHPGVPVRPIEEIAPTAVTEHKPGVLIFDLGQNISGVVRLKVKGKAGDKVTIRYAEMLHTDGRLCTENLRCARAVDTYMLKGDPDGETWTPDFTYHGFQYVEAHRLSRHPRHRTPSPASCIHSDTPLHGSFECSDPMLNRLYQNMVWTQRANFFEMPTDCPQRDERMGWTGDAQVYVRAATYNADIAAFYTKWLRDLNDDQWDYGAYPDFAPPPLIRPNEHHAAAWGDAGIICPWTIWQVYGDTRVIPEHWRKMEEFMDWRAAPRPGTQGRDRRLRLRRLALARRSEDTDRVHRPRLPRLRRRLMAEMAAAIGDDAKAAHYRKRHAQGHAGLSKGLSQAGWHTRRPQPVDLRHGPVLRPDSRPAAQRAADTSPKLIRDNGNKMTTGFLGTRPLLPALSASGHHDISGILMQQREYPSWGYEVDNGATTIWERWNSYIKGQGVHEPAMNSFSHYAFGAVCEWMMTDLAGIDRAAPGFDRVRIAPRPTGTITHAAASTETRHGKLACSWKIEDDKIHAEVTVPPNTTADVILPVKGSVTESGRDAASAAGVLEANGNRFVTGSGTYRFSADFEQ